MQKLSLILLFVLFCSYPQKTLREEFEECKEIIPYPSDKPDDCTKYLIHSHDINSETGDIVHYRCCMWFDKYFNHRCYYHLSVQRSNELEYEKRTVVQGNHYYCKDNNYPDSLLQCAYSKDIGANKCSKNIILNKDALEYNNYTYDRCCYVSYQHYQACAPFPSDDQFIEDYLDKMHNEGYDSYTIKCGGNSSKTVSSDDFGEEVTKDQCESIFPKSIGDCTKHTIIESDIRTIDGKRYDKCCFYEIGNGDNTCKVLPNDEDLLKEIRESTKNYLNSKVNLIDCKSCYLIIRINLLLIYLIILF